MTYETMTAKQYEYLKDLIPRHPNFKKETKYDGTFQVGADGEPSYYLNTGDPYPADKELIGTVDEVQTAWVNSKYGQYLDNLINSIHDLNVEQASALITHLSKK